MASTFMIAISIFVGVIAVFLTSTMTAGVVAAVAAVWLAIVARMVQAEAHHRELLAAATPQSRATQPK